MCKGGDKPKIPPDFENSEKSPPDFWADSRENGRRAERGGHFVGNLAVGNRIKTEFKPDLGTIKLN